MSSSFRSIALQWNLKYPIDKWWRDKYKVPFNSTQHSSMCILDIRLQYEEDLLFAQKANAKQSDTYVPGEGLIFKKAEITQDQTQSLYESIDLDKIDSDDSGTIEIDY